MTAAGEPKRRCGVCHASYERGERFCSLDGGAVVEDGGAVEDPLIGKMIDGRYLVRKLLGRGGMGAVYEADHVGLDKTVAIKFVTYGDGELELRARFRQEARAASRIANEHVVHVFDVGVDDGRDYIVMEHVEGRDLRKLLEAGPLEPGRVIELGRQLLRGLQAIHDAGIVHRDIKPANILLTNREVDFVKIMDFGIAKAMLTEVGQTDTGTGRVLGTPQFMAPEQLVDGEVDHRADLYAVGVTLYQLLTGALPFDGTSVTGIAAVVDQPAPSVEALRPDVPAPLASAITCALAKSPADRFPDALAFADALGATGLAPASAPARTPQTPSSPDAVATVAERRSSAVAPRQAATDTDRAPRSARRRWAAVAAVGLIAIAAISIVLSLTQRSARDVGPAADVVAAGGQVATTAVADALDRARAAERRGDLALAIAAYREAYAIGPEPDPLFRIGDLYQRIGDRARAAEYLQRYLDAAPAAADRDVVRQRIATLVPAANPPPAVTDDPAAPIPRHRPPGRKVRNRGPDPEARECLCRTTFDDGTTTNICLAKRPRARCTCATADHDDLCPVKWTTEDYGEVLPDDAPSGTRYCVDRTRAECRVLGSNKPEGCGLLYEYGRRPGATCVGYGALKWKPNAQQPGTYACDHCAWAPRHRGRPGDRCIGYAAADGSRREGVMYACREK